MAYYLQFPTARSSTFATVYGVTGNAIIELEFKQAITASSSGDSYLFDGRVGGGDGYLLKRNSGTLDFRVDTFEKNGTTVSAVDLFTASVDDVISFRSTDTGSSFVLGARFTGRDSWSDFNYSYIKVTDDNGVHIIDMSDSGGTGTSVTSDTGTLTMTLSNFNGTTNSWWVFYDDGGSISASVAQTISKPVFSIASSFVAPVTISADIAYTIAKPIFATAASKVVPTFTSDLAFNVAKPLFATAASTTVPVFTSALTVDISKPIFAVIAENGQLVITSAVATSISKPVFSVAADNQVLIINSAIALSVSKPAFSIALSNSVPIFTVNTAFDITKPIFSIASTTTEPGNASALIAVLVDAPIFSVSTSLINPLLSTIDFSIDAPVFSVLNSATRPTLSAEITVDVTAPTFSVIANNGIQVYYYRSGTQVITYSQNTQIKIRTLNTNQPLYTSARHRKI